MDRLNAKLGRGTVRILSAGPKDAAWKLRAEYRSPRWTTPWEEPLTASARRRIGEPALSLSCYAEAHSIAYTGVTRWQGRKVLSVQKPLGAQLRRLLSFRIR